MKSIRSLLAGPGGDISSKRFISIGCFVMAVFSTVADKPYEVTAIWIGASLALLGVAAFTKS